MSVKVTFVLGAAMALALLARTRTAADAPSPVRTCANGQVPIPWPLGDSGFQARRLLTSHGQYLDLPLDDLGDDWPPFLHRGIDLAACVGDEVYAIESGWVEDVSFGLVDGYNQVVIADDDEDDVGWSYLHLDTVHVEVGEFVERDQAIGTVIAFPRWGGYDHLHLQRVAPAAGAGASLFDGQIDAGNPLPMLVARADDRPPRVLAPDMPVPAVVPFRFYEDDDPSKPLLPGALDGAKVDVIARVEEVFPGTGKPFCPPIVCDGKTIAHEIMPVRISFSIFRTVPAPDGISYPATVRKREFHNVIELDRDLLYEDGPELKIYQAETVSTYTERKFVILLTHCQDTGAGSFKFSESGEHLLQLVLEDASSNTTVREMTIDVSAP